MVGRCGRNRILGWVRVVFTGYICDGCVWGFAKKANPLDAAPGAAEMTREYAEIIAELMEKNDD